MAIESGVRVEVTTATGEKVSMWAVSGPQPGIDFPVVWVATEQEFAEAENGQEIEGIPWPVDAVRLA